jgi:hypothetical protein
MMASANPTLAEMQSSVRFISRIKYSKSRFRLNYERKCSISSSKSIQIHPYDPKASQRVCAKVCEFIGENICLNQLDCTFELTERAVLNPENPGRGFSGNYAEAEAAQGTGFVRSR